MEELEVKGIILSAFPQGEYGRRLSILTDRLGKVTAFARGAAKESSKIIGSVRPMTAAAFTLAKGRGGYSIHGVDTMESFEGLPMDPDASCYAFYVLELGDWFSAEGMPEQEAKQLLNLMYFSLLALKNRSLQPLQIQHLLELRLLVLSGEYTQAPENRRPDENDPVYRLWSYVLRCRLTALYDPEQLRAAVRPEENGMTEDEMWGQFGDSAEYLFKKQVNHKFRALQILRDLG